MFCKKLQPCSSVHLKLRSPLLMEGTMGLHRIL